MNVRRVVTMTLLTAGSLVGCASVEDTGGTGQMQGTSGSVAWAVLDLRERVAPDGNEIRWYYTLLLRETAGRAIQFETQERGASGYRVFGSVSAEPFRQRLGRNSELRWSYRDGIFFTAAGAPGFGEIPGGRGGMTVFRRFSGKDETGSPVTVDVRIVLAPGAGKRIQPPAPAGPLPPVRVLEAGDLGRLAGKWQGHYRDTQGFEIPLQVTVKDDGSFEAAPFVPT